VVKARTSAAALVESGHVRINGVREKSPGACGEAGRRRHHPRSTAACGC